MIMAPMVVLEFLKEKRSVCWLKMCIRDRNNPPLNILTLEVSAEMRDTLQDVYKRQDYTIDVDTVIMSLGTSPNPLISSTTEGLETNKWKCIIADETNGKTTKEGAVSYTHLKNRLLQVR